MAACFVTLNTSMIQLGNLLIINFIIDNNVSFTSQAGSMRKVDYYLSLVAGIGKTSLVITEDSSQCLWMTKEGWNTQNGLH